MSRRESPWLRRLSLLIGYPFFFPTSVLIGLELCVRLFMPQELPRDAPEIYVPDEVIGWRHEPGVRTWVNTGERDVEICFDAKGDRVSCSVAPRSDCSRRILIVGDSYVEALAVPYEQTVWSRIERDTGACVDAAGVGAYKPSQYVQQARERLGSPGRYDLAILSFYAGNDFTDDPDTLPEARDVWRRPLRLLPAGLDRASLSDWFYPINQWLESRSHAYVALRFALRRYSDPGDVGIYGIPGALRRSRLTEKTVTQTARVVERVAEAAHRAGTRLLVTVIPIRNQVTDPDAARLKRALPNLADDLQMDLVQERFIPRIAQIPDVVIVDLLPGLRAADDRADWGVRDGHFSPQGHARWFALLRDPVRRMLEEQASD